MSDSVSLPAEGTQVIWEGDNSLWKIVEIGIDEAGNFVALGNSDSETIIWLSPEEFADECVVAN